MQKFVANRRITETTIRELDQKVQMESYLREKKEAILEDRKNEKTIDSLNINSKPQDDDQKSALQQVQEKYQNIREDAEYARSRRSQISKTASRVARSGAPQSMVGSAALMR